MTIFIPVIWICINAHCEFMQQQGYLIDEQECTEEVVKQKQKMREMVEVTDGTITQIEGTCIDATIKRTAIVKTQQ